MPLYNFKCIDCGATKRKLLESEERAQVACIICDCGSFMERNAQAPSARVTEVLDNGMMVRKVERLQDAERIYKDRSHGDNTPT
jgi:hypothetical protein